MVQNQNPPATRGLRSVIRVQKEDSAFVYFVLEALEGVTSYRTLDQPPLALYRDLELLTPPDFADDTIECLKDLSGKVLVLESEIPTLTQSLLLA